MGLRPGEKLHEELRAPDEQAVPTEVEKMQVLRTKGSELEGSAVERVSQWEVGLQEASSGEGVLREVWELCGVREEDVVGHYAFIPSRAGYGERVGVEEAE